MKLSEINHSEHGYDIHTIENWGVGIPVIHPPLMHTSMDTHMGFVFDEPPTWSSISLEGPYRNDGIYPI